MTYTEASHLNLAIAKCIQRCRQSTEPYHELAEFINALRQGGVAEHYIQAINVAALRDIAAMITTPPAPALTAPPTGYCYILQ